ncbi:MAG: tetratricopeptide repeat protein [Prevotella sp.]|jgi:TolA-binding protein|nr:tetratricopeptide repeat protein [Prevotella sp.]
MKKLLVALGIALSLQFAYAQKSVYTELPDRLFSQGKEMFLDNNYVGCISTLEKFKAKTKDKKEIQEAEYMIVGSMYYMGKEDSKDLLEKYLKKYPETYHRNQLTFFIGSTYFAQKDWGNALYWFSQSDMDYLSLSEQEDYSYRLAYANLQAGSRDDAKRLFGLLTRNSGKYSEPASYYLAYANFQDGEYEQAVPIFRRLKAKPEYKEPASFFLIQSAFLQNDLNGTISEGQDYLSAYPNNVNSIEVYRLLGNSYYRLGNTSSAINSYERYVESTNKPFRNDMYQLAEAYYQTGAYSKTVNALKHVASTDDLLGQAGYMLLGQSYIKINDTPNAIMAFEAASRVSFDRTISEEALYNFVMLMNRNGASGFGEAITASQRFLTQYPNSRYTDEVNEALASTLLSSKNYTMALSAINSIKSPGRQILDAKQAIMYQLGVQDFIDGKYDNAINQFNNTITLGNYNTEVRNESYFWRGEAFYKRGDYQSAARDYTSYVSNAPQTKENYAIALYNLAYTEFNVKNYNKALNSFRKYTSAEKNHQSLTYSDALNRIGDCYLYNRNFSQAETYYSQAASVNPKNADYAEFQKAFVLGMQRNYAGKIAALNNMMSRFPSSEYYDDALFEKSRALVMMDRESEAITELERLLRDYSRSNLAQEAGIQLGQLYFNTNNPQKSIEAYKKVVSNNPNSEEARTAIQSLEAVYKDINDINSYASYVNSLGRGTILSSSRQDTLTYLAAENVYMKNRKEEAVGAFNKYLQSYPNGVFASDAHFYLGNMAFDNKNFDPALEHLKMVVNSNNRKYMNEALIIVSGIEFDKKNYEAAYAAYDHLSMVASTKENKDIGRLGMLRSAYLMKKDNEVVSAADNLLNEANLSGEVKNEARFYRGQSLKNLGQMEKALTDLREVAKDTRTAFGAESNYLLADAYYQMKSYDNAEKQVLGFMKEGTSHQYWLARAIILLSDVYVAKSDKFQARQYLESLQANYKGTEADIKEMISTRIAALRN